MICVLGKLYGAMKYEIIQEMATIVVVIRTAFSHSFFSILSIHHPNKYLYVEHNAQESITQEHLLIKPPKMI